MEKLKVGLVSVISIHTQDGKICIMTIKIFNKIRERYHLNLIDLDRKNENFSKASDRIRDFIDEFDQEKYYYLIAVDGVFNLANGELSIAHLRLEECLSIALRLKGEDGKYVSLFCQCLLSLRNSKDEWRTIRRDALQFQPSRRVLRFLSFPSEERSMEIIESTNKAAPSN